MLRQSLVRLRLGSLAAAGSQAAAAAAAEGGAAWAPQSTAALQLLGRWQQAGQGEGAGRQQQHYNPVRHLSIWPGGGGSKDSSSSTQPPPDSVAAGGELDAFGGTVSSSGASLDSMASTAADVAASSPVSDLFTATAIVAAASLAEGDALALAQEDAWIGSRLVQSLLSSVHASTGLPWWGDIMLCTLAMRLSTLPVMISQIKNTYRLSQARPEMEALMEYLKEEQARGNPEAAQQHTKRVMAVWKKYNCNPFKSFAGMFVQMPVFIGFFSALRALATAKVPSLAEGGALWFTDLTVADPTFMLPVLAGASFLATIELGAADGMEGQPEETRKRMKNIMRVVALAVPLVSTAIPASVFMYWTASNTFSLLQTTVLKSRAVKKALGLPDLRAMHAATAGAAGATSAAASSAAGAAAAVPRPVTFASKPPPKKSNN